MWQFCLPKNQSDQFFIFFLKFFHYCLLLIFLQNSLTLGTWVALHRARRVRKLLVMSEDEQKQHFLVSAQYSGEFTRWVVFLSTSTNTSDFKWDKNLHYTRGITPKRITSDGAHLRNLAAGQRSSEEVSQQRRVVGDTASDSTGPGIDPQIFTDSVCSTTELTNYNQSENTKVLFFAGVSLRSISNPYQIRSSCSTTLDRL